MLDYVNHNATLAKSDFIRLFREALLCAPHSNNVLEQTGVGGLLKTNQNVVQKQKLHHTQAGVLAGVNIWAY